MRSIIDLSFIGDFSDASKSRNGFVDLMLEILLYSTLTCPQADAIMLKIKANEDLEKFIKIELVETVKESTPECKWDAND
jgi:hypothetical protein